MCWCGTSEQLVTHVVRQSSDPKPPGCAEWGAVLFVVTLSLGESVWSPRWYDYSMSLAPEGREGIFTALASAPLFAAKLPTGEASPSLRLRQRG